MNNSSSCTQLFFIIIIINYVCIAGKDRKAVTTASWEILNVWIWLDQDVWYEEREKDNDK